MSWFLQSLYLERSTETSHIKIFIVCSCDLCHCFPNGLPTWSKNMHQTYAFTSLSYLDILSVSLWVAFINLICCLFLRLFFFLMNGLKMYFSPSVLSFSLICNKTLYKNFTSFITFKAQFTKQMCRNTLVISYCCRTAYKIQFEKLTTIYV